MPYLHTLRRTIDASSALDGIADALDRPRD